MTTNSIRHARNSGRPRGTPAQRRKLPVLPVYLQRLLSTSSRNGALQRMKRLNGAKNFSASSTLLLG